MIDATHELPIVRQAQLLDLARSTVYYQPQPTSDADLALMRRIDELHLEHPFAGSRMLRDLLNREGIAGRPQACGDADAPDGHRGAVSAAADQRPASRASGVPVSAARRHHRPAQSGLGDGHDLHPDAPRLRVPDRGARLGQPPRSGVAPVDQPGCGRCRRGAWRRRSRKHGAPEIMNTDQGSQFTASAFIDVLRRHDIRISMDGKGCWRDNVFVERLWKSVKYEHVYLHAYETTTEARMKLAVYLDFYNRRRPHSSLDRQAPDDVYFNQPPLRLAA